MNCAPNDLASPSCWGARHSPDDAPEPAGGADGLQASHADAEHEDLRRARRRAAAVMSIGKNCPKVSAATITALQPATLA